MDALAPISTVKAVDPLQTAPKTSDSGAFATMLRSAIQSVEAQSQFAGTQVDRFLAGDGVDLHSVAIASQKASLQFELFMQMRNKVVSAYQDIMRMQL